MRLKQLSAVTIGLLILSYAAVAQESKSQIKVSDLTKIKQITDVQVRPDGSEVAYAVKEVVSDTAVIGGYTYKTSWFTQQVPDIRAVRKQENQRDALPSNNALAHKEAIQKIYYSADGKRWALVKGKGKDQQLHGYSSADPDSLPFYEAVPYPVQEVLFSAKANKALLSVKLTLQDLLESADFNPESLLPAWPYESPGDSKNISVKKSAASPDPDGDAEQVAAYLQQNEEKSIAKRTNKLRFQTESSTTGTLYFTHWYAVDLKDGGKAEPLTSGFRSYPRAAFLSDRQIISEVSRDTLAHPDRVNTSDIVLIDLNTRAQQKVLGDGIYRYQLEAVARSGKKLALTRSQPNTLTQDDLWIYNVADWSKTPITYDRSVAQVHFGPGDSDVYFTSPSNGGKVLNRAAVATGKVTVLTSVDEGVNDYWIGKQAALYSKTTFANPSELFLAGTDFKHSGAITEINAGWLQDKSVAKPEKFTFTNELGLEVEYWLLKPADASAQQKAPLLVQIHGGPASMFGPGDGSMWHEYQYFLAKGYGVLYGNPRGSNGYGEAFLQANYRDWGKGPSSDVLKAVDQVTEQGWVDTDHLYLTGGSYGAFLTTWIIAHDHRFRAASSQRGVYDLYTFFGSGNVWPMLKRYFGGFPWEDGIMKVLQEQSPISYATQIKTPLLIFHGENDNRTGPTQSDYLYKELKYLERDVEYVRHPDADHEITRSGNVAQRIDQMLRTYEFFERFR